MGRASDEKLCAGLEQELPEECSRRNPRRIFMLAALVLGAVILGAGMVKASWVRIFWSSIKPHDPECLWS